MATEIRVPTLGESVTEATIGKWFKQPGDAVKADEPLVELETDKVTVEVPAPVAGTLSDILAKDGAIVGVGALLGSITEAAAAAVPAKAETPKPPAPAPVPAPAVIAKAPAVAAETASAASLPVPASARAADAVREERVKMSKLRQTIARRLKDAQNTAAMLTTFNDVDMSAVMSLRTRYKDAFEKRHGVKLGFMGFFTKAVIQALKEILAVNAEIVDSDIVYKNYYNIGIAVGTERGLVVPVVRDADRLSIAEIEKAISTFGRKARDGKLGVEDMQGGTFTITNGGTYGSLISTPILNAPQSGILGMHRIEERPVVVKGQVVIRPMMYLALSYDHRIVDGREAVTFLARVKETLEDPTRLALDL